MNTTKSKIVKLEQILVDYFVKYKMETDFVKLDKIEKTFEKSVKLLIEDKDISYTIMAIASDLSILFNKGKIGLVDLVSSILNLAPALLKNEA